MKTTDGNSDILETAAGAPTGPSSIVASERVAQREGSGDAELKKRIQAERLLAGSRLIQH